MKTYYIPPKKGDRKSWEHILKRMPPASEFTGLVWKQRIILPVNQPRYKNPKGQDKNSCRSNTKGRSSSVFSSFENGINPSCQPPKLVGTDLRKLEAFAGYGRKGIFDALDISYWVFDRYEFDKDDYTDREKLIILRNAGNDDNGDNMPFEKMSKTDYIMQLVDFILKENWNESQCKDWFRKRRTFLSDDTKKSYITEAFKKVNAIGRVQHFSKTETDQLFKDSFSSQTEVELINTTDAERGNLDRILRKLPYALLNYAKDGQIQEYCAWNGNAESHEELDDSVEYMQRGLATLHKDILRYAARYNSDVLSGKIKMGFVPMQITSCINQKIEDNQDIPLGSIVELDIVEDVDMTEE